MTKLAKESKEFLKVLETYKWDEHPPKVFEGRTILHCYPREDTQTKAGLIGFADALLFDVHVYSVRLMKRFKFEGHDQIELGQFCSNVCLHPRFRFFKDGSAMFIFDEPISFGCFQSLEILPANDLLSKNPL